MKKGMRFTFYKKVGKKKVKEGTGKLIRKHFLITGKDFKIEYCSVRFPGIKKTVIKSIREDFKKELAWTLD
jgi:hypothetical protein